MTCPQACQPVFPLQVVVEAPALSEPDAQHLLRTTQDALDDLNAFPAHRLSLTLRESGDPTAADAGDQYDEDGAGEPALQVQLHQDDDVPAVQAEVRPHSTTLDVRYASSHAPSGSSGPSALGSALATKLHDLFAEEQASIAKILLPAGAPMPPSLAAFAAPLAQRETRALKYAPEYHITLSLVTPTGAPTSWDIATAVATHLRPLLAAYPLSAFTLDTQVLPHSPFAPSAQQPSYDAAGGAWTLRADELGSFVNAAEWPLSPAAGAAPNLNFLLYVPRPAQAPLRVAGSGATAWLVPQWGGVAVLNPPPAPGAPAPGAPPPEHLSAADLAPALRTFAHQLLALLGAPDAPGLGLPLPLRSLTRVQAAATLRAAASTLGSLAHLSRSMAAIPIPESVAHGTNFALAELRGACGALAGRRFAAALRHARDAEGAAERAFFEKSMVGQVYFPDEHKVAVFLPLLGPVAVPLVTSAVREVARWRKMRRGG